MKKIKKIDENGIETIYPTFELAARSVQTKIENWKVQMFIAYAVQTKTRAFKCRWEQI